MNDKRTLSKTLANAILRVLGWRVQVTWPSTNKYVLIGAPHTSNLDFVYMLLFKFAIGLDPHWVGKDSMFRWPLGGLWNKIGGIPVNRRSRNNFVDQMVEAFRQRDEMILVISPEGTRSKVGYWKSGFYYIALGAGVPIMLGFLDFGRKMGGIGPAIMPTGDIQADFTFIRNFYAGMKGRHPQRQGEIMLRSD